MRNIREDENSFLQQLPWRAVTVRSPDICRIEVMGGTEQLRQD
jgi:hypothetical protein